MPWIGPRRVTAPALQPVRLLWASTSVIPKGEEPRDDPGLFRDYNVLQLPLVTWGTPAGGARNKGSVACFEDLLPRRPSLKDYRKQVAKWHCRALLRKEKSNNSLTWFSIGAPDQSTQLQALCIVLSLGLKVMRCRCDIQGDSGRSKAFKLSSVFPQVLFGMIDAMCRLCTLSP